MASTRTTDEQGQQTSSAANAAPPTSTVVDGEAPPSSIDITPSTSTQQNREIADESQLSKNQRKKRQRWERKLEIKRRRKEQDKAARHARARAAGRDIAQEQQLAANNSGRQREYKRHQWMTHKQPLLQTSFEVCIDCAFETSMTAKEINSLASQVRYCYARNKRNDHPCRLAATSVGINQGESSTSSLGRHLENVDGHEEWEHWGFTMTSLSLEQYYEQKRQSIVYLTSDSDTVITELENSKIYVIGGIVDRNRLRRAAIDRAEGLGLSTARLPIDEHLQALKTTRVLTCNHVFELLLHARNGDWKNALLKVLPQRKGAQPKDDLCVKSAGGSPDEHDAEPITTEK